MGQRRRAREHALQMLFQIDLTGVSPRDVFRDFWTDHTAPSEIRGFAEELVLGVYGDLRELDRWIIGSAEHWRIERMAVVDRNVLRMAVHEIVHDAETPDAVIIDEAIEVAKKYGSEESGSFINGVLDAIRKRKERGDLASTPGGQDG
jgi:N utilization substance protein B